ncbi:hypothetical protein VPH35_093721 [Triticum aestivum]
MPSRRPCRPQPWSLQQTRTSVSIPPSSRTLATGHSTGSPTRPAPTPVSAQGSPSLRWRPPRSPRALPRRPSTTPSWPFSASRSASSPASLRSTPSSPPARKSRGRSLPGSSRPLTRSTPPSGLQPPPPMLPQPRISPLSLTPPSARPSRRRWAVHTRPTSSSPPSSPPSRRHTPFLFLIGPRTRTWSLRTP